MPIINDSTVVASAYQTCASARPQILSNGWIVSCLYNNGMTYFYVSKDNGVTFTQLCWFASRSIWSSIVSYGTIVYVLSDGSGITNDAKLRLYKFNALTQTNVALTVYNYLDSLQTDMFSNSLAINSTGTELHACWASCNPNYGASLNIRYSKGVISSTDGSVAWDNIEQVTKVVGNGYGINRPSIILDKNNIPVIICDTVSIAFNNDGSTQQGLGSVYSIVIFKRDLTLPHQSSYVFNTVWSAKNISGNGVSWQFSSPSAIFVPQLINGLTNGRIWVTWQGSDSASATNIRVSYSDDGGVTWSTMQKLSTGSNPVDNQTNPSITANTNNEVFILWKGNDVDGNGTNYIRKIKNINSAWGSIDNFKVINNAYDIGVSTLFNLNVKFTDPLFIYKDFNTNKVGFYGSWITVTLKTKIDGALKEYSDGWVKIDGVLRKIESIKVKIDGVLRNM